MCPRWIDRCGFLFIRLTEEWGCSVLLWVMVDQWQTEHKPSKSDGHTNVRGDQAAYQYNARLGTESQMLWWANDCGRPMNWWNWRVRSGLSCGVRCCQQGCGNESIIPWWLQGLADGGSDSVNGQGQTLGMELHVWNCARRSLTHAP